MRPAIYSGEGRSGICMCGHSWEDHHLGIVMNEKSLQVHNGELEGYIPQECEFYGCNEEGGLDAEGNDHCSQYRDSLLPDEHN